MYMTSYIVDVQVKVTNILMIYMSTNTKQKMTRPRATQGLRLDQAVKVRFSSP